jgi:hypothetical protein
MTNRALAAEDIRAQKFVLEFATRVVLPAELNEVGQPFINRFQLVWGGGKQFPPMRPGRVYHALEFAADP